MNATDTATFDGFVLKALLSTLLDTGMRISSALHLNEEDVDFERNLLHYWDFKNNMERYVDLTPRLAYLLKLLLKKNSKVKNRTPALFIKKDGSRLSYDSAKWSINKISEKSGLKFSFHCFRHTFAVMFLVHGGDLRSLMKVGGWKSLKAVQRYSKLADHVAFEQHKKHSPLTQLDE